MVKICGLTIGLVCKRDRQAFIEIGFNVESFSHKCRVELLLAKNLMIRRKCDGSPCPTSGFDLSDIALGLTTAKGLTMDKIVAFDIHHQLARQGIDHAGPDPVQTA